MESITLLIKTENYLTYQICHDKLHLIGSKDTSVYTIGLQIALRGYFVAPKPIR